MFDSIRKHQRLLLFFLVILILPAFVFFGISGYDRMLSGDQGVAVVDGTPVTEQEFAEAQRRQIDSLRQMLGDAVDVRMFDTPEARAEILEGLIARRVLAGEANRSRLSVNDLQVRDAILAIPGLRREDGSFDDARYRALLASQNLSAAGFEALVRRDLAVQALPDAVSASAFVPQTVRDRVIALQEEKRQIREMRFAPEAFAAQVQPTEDALKKFYDENARLFETPEVAKVDYVVLGRDALAGQIAISPDELRSYYEQNKARYGAPEERRAGHILLAPGPDARARADELLARLKANPGEFEELAKQHSADPGSASQGGDLGYFDRTSMVKPFADAAFAMQPGEVGGPIETEFGLHIIRVTDVRPAQTKSFEEVRPQLEAEIRSQQAGQRFAEAAESFTNTVYEQSDSLKPAADKFKLEIRSEELVARQPGPDAQPGSPLGNPRLLQALFSDDVLKNKRNTEAIEVAPGRLASARIVDYRPPQRRPFAEVEADVRQRYVAQQAAQLARQAGTERLTALRDPGTPTDAQQDFRPMKTVQRGAPGDLDPRAVEAVFRMPVEPLPAVAGVDLGEQGFAIYQLVEVVPASPEAIAERRQAIEPQLARVVSQQDLVAYIDALKQRAKIARHPERLNRERF
jgi:peptidyl-prolyl cis-trans isomerase D